MQTGDTMQELCNHICDKTLTLEFIQEKKLTAQDFLEDSTGFFNKIMSITCALALASSTGQLHKIPTKLFLKNNRQAQEILNAQSQLIKLAQSPESEDYKTVNAQNENWLRVLAQQVLAHAGANHSELPLSKLKRLPASTCHS
jgi:hypothetical protein